jgi:uncharacterized protein (TIGR00251 family)
MPFALQAHELGVILPIRAQPGAGRNALLGEHHGTLKVAVTQAPEKGKANKAVIEVLAKSLCIKRSQIELLSGETSQQKKFLIREISLAELADKLRACNPDDAGN